MFKHFLPVIMLVIGIDMFGQSPPNGVEIAPFTFIDRTEISILHYQEFIYFVERDSSQVYLESIMPDSVVCPSSYLRNKENRDKPVIGLSRWDMEQYCKWRTQMVSKKLNLKIVYRLPTKEEWLLAYQKYSGRERVARRMIDVKSGRHELKGMNGNVSELVHDLDIVMGNNWRGSNDRFLDVDLNIDCDRPHDWVGFRCIALIGD